MQKEPNFKLEFGSFICIITWMMIIFVVWAGVHV